MRAIPILLGMVGLALLVASYCAAVAGEAVGAALLWVAGFVVLTPARDDIAVRIKLRQIKREAIRDHESTLHRFGRGAHLGASLPRDVSGFVMRVTDSAARSGHNLRDALECLAVVAIVVMIQATIGIALL